MLCLAACTCSRYGSVELCCGCRCPALQCFTALQMRRCEEFVDALCACNAAGYLSHVYILNKTYCSHEEEWSVCAVCASACMPKPSESDDGDRDENCHECQAHNRRYEETTETMNEQSSHTKWHLLWSVTHSSIIHVIRFHNKQYKRIKCHS